MRKIILSFGQGPVIRMAMFFCCSRYLPILYEDFRLNLEETLSSFLT